MSDCQCLTSDRRLITIDALDTYKLLTEDMQMQSTIEAIKREISECVCPLGTTSSKGKRAPSKYNLHTSSCMKSGKSMKECASEWNSIKGASP